MGLVQELGSLLRMKVKVRLVSSFHPFGVKGEVLSLSLSPLPLLILPAKWANPHWAKNLQGWCCQLCSHPSRETLLPSFSSSSDPLEGASDPKSQLAIIPSWQPPLPVAAYVFTQGSQGRLARQERILCPGTLDFPSIMPPLTAFLLSPWVEQTTVV